MTAFNFFSHGSQDLYPTFLREQHHFDPHTVSWNHGRIEYRGNLRRPLFRGDVGEDRTTLGDFHRRVDRVAVLAAVGFFHYAGSARHRRIPDADFGARSLGGDSVHLNEISPDEIRATFPGLVYQLGNLLASVNATMQASIAVSHGNNYGMTMAVVAGTVAVVIAGLIFFSREADAESI